MIFINLLPVPQQLQTKEGVFTLTDGVSLFVGADCHKRLFDEGLRMKDLLHTRLQLDLQVTGQQPPQGAGIVLQQSDDGEGEQYTLSIRPEGIVLQGAERGLFYAMQTLKQLVLNYGRNLPCLEISDAPTLANRGFYHDITRGQVPKRSTLFELIDQLSFYKINQLQLYVEHTFAFSKWEKVWADCSPLTAEDILALDAYCAERYIELVPSIATFGHLYHALECPDFQHLREVDLNRPFSWVDRMGHHTLDCSNPQSFAFIKQAIEEFLPLFSSNRFNICCDETFDLGQGKSKEYVEQKGKGEAYLDFVLQLIALLQSHGKQVMLWADIVLAHGELLERLPKDVIYLNWDYEAVPNEANIVRMEEQNLEQYLCPALWGWNRMLPRFETATPNIVAMARLAAKHKATGLLNTDWGDFGHVQLYPSSLPGMILGAALSWNNTTEVATVDRGICQLAFDDTTERLMPLLTDLSTAEHVCWENIISWMERKFQNIDVRHDLWQVFEQPEEIEASIAPAIKARDALLRFYDASDAKYQEEWCCAAQGAVWEQQLALHIVAYDFGYQSTTVTLAPKQLADDMLTWLERYTVCWEKVNQASELFRIQRTVRFLADWLCQQ